MVDSEPSVQRTEDAELMPAGTIFAEHYEVIECIGQGGMSTVYKARDLNISRMVALKCLRAHSLGDSTALARFQREAKNAGSLEHPNIVRIDHYGVDTAGVPYIIMELVEGQSLSQLLAVEPPMKCPRAVAILSQVCDGLYHSHSKGIIHRDLKPSNIMVVKQSGKEIVKIVDFGIAKLLTADDPAKNLTITGDMIGSPLFMSPEQCMMMDLDARSDIYALGCLINCVFTGKPPFYSENLYEVHYSHINELPDSIAPVRKDLDEALEIDAILLRCMAKEPSDRYQTAAEVKQVLLKLTSPERKSVLHRLRRGLKLHELRQKAKKHPRLKKVLIGVTAVYLCLTAVGAWFLFNSMIGPQDNSWRSFYAQGQSEMDTANYAKARSSLSQALSLAARSSSQNELMSATLCQLVDFSRILNEKDNLHKYERQLDEVRLKLERSDPELDEELSKAVITPKQQLDDKQTAALCDRANDAATVHLKIGNVSKAQKLLADAHTLLLRLPDAHDDVMARCLHNQALADHRAGNLLEAEKLYRQAANLVKSKLSAASPILGKSLIGIGKIDISKHDFVAAESTLREALSIYRAAFGPQSEQVAWIKVNLGELYINEKRPDLAKTELRQAKLIYDSVPNPDTNDKKTRCYALLATVEGNDEMLKEALALQENSPKQEDVYLAWILTELGEHEERRRDALSRLSQANAYVPLYERAVAIYLRSVPREQERIWSLIDRLEQHCHRQGTLKDMEPWYELKTQADEHLYGAVSTQVAEDLLRQAQFYRRLPDLYLSEKKFREALKIEAFVSGGKDWNTFETLAGLAELCLDDKRLRESETFFKKAMEILAAEHSQDAPAAAIKDYIFRYCSALDLLNKHTESALLKEKFHKYL